jgi:hypothetical protein
MKTLPLKKIGIGIAAIIVFGIAIFYFKSGVSLSTSTRSMNPAFGAYIASYTAGVVPSNSVIQIVLAKDYADSSMVGKETSVKLFDISPSVNGKTVWLNASTVEFRPESRLKSGQVYEATFNLSRIMDVPKDLSKFNYSFQIIPQNFEVSIENITPYVKTELKRQRVEGLLISADFADGDDIEKILKASQDGKSLKINWVHGSDGVHGEAARRPGTRWVQTKPTPVA